MNKNFRKTSLIALMSMAIINMFSSEAMAALQEGTSLGGDDQVIIGGITTDFQFSSFFVSHYTFGSRYYR